jgi:hypothetical protein
VPAYGENRAPHDDCFRHPGGPGADDSLGDVGRVREDRRRTSAMPRERSSAPRPTLMSRRRPSAQIRAVPLCARKAATTTPAASSYFQTDGVLWQRLGLRQRQGRRPAPDGGVRTTPSRPEPDGRLPLRDGLHEHRLVAGSCPVFSVLALKVVDPWMASASDVDREGRALLNPYEAPAHPCPTQWPSQATGRAGQSASHLGALARSRSGHPPR